MATRANSISAPRVNRSAVMKAAWEGYRAYYRARPWLKHSFNRSDFSFYLACAWMKAKRALLTEKEARAEAIRDQIELLPFKPLRLNVDARRRSLEAELSALAA